MKELEKLEYVKYLHRAFSFRLHESSFTVNVCFSVPAQVQMLKPVTTKDWL